MRADRNNIWLRVRDFLEEGWKFIEEMRNFESFHALVFPRQKT